MITGGVPVSVSFDGIEFVFVGDAAPEIDGDGVEVTREANANNTVRKLFAPQPWSMTGCVVEADYAIYQQLLDIKNAKTDPPISIELEDGTVLMGTGGPTEIKFNPAKATASFDVSGEGELKPT